VTFHLGLFLVKKIHLDLIILKRLLRPNKFLQDLNSADEESQLLSKVVAIPYTQFCVGSNIDHSPVEDVLIHLKCHHIPGTFGRSAVDVSHPVGVLRISSINEVANSALAVDYLKCHNPWFGFKSFVLSIAQLVSD
jgi:hypothetical protein